MRGAGLPGPRLAFRARLLALPDPSAFRMVLTGTTVALTVVRSGGARDIAIVTVTSCRIVASLTEWARAPRGWCREALLQPLSPNIHCAV